MPWERGRTSRNAPASSPTRKQWPAYLPEAVVGVVSDFAGDNEFMGQELLNLIGRTNQQYAILLKTKLPATPFRGLRAVIYADAQPPAAELRKQILDFVSAGRPADHRSEVGRPARRAGQGRTSPVRHRGRSAKAAWPFAKTDPDDPYVLANDSALLISHRYELLRFWNGGAVGSYLTVAPDRKRAVAHMLFYADRGPGPGERAHRGTLAQGQPVDPGPRRNRVRWKWKRRRMPWNSICRRSPNTRPRNSRFNKMHKNCSRREWLLRTAAAVPGAWLAGSRLSRAAAAPALPVAVAKCKTYDAAELVPTLSKMFDQLGGLGRLVNGKTVGIKINLTGDPSIPAGLRAAGRLALHPSAGDRRHGAPVGPRGRAAHPPAGEPLGHRRSGGRSDAPRQLGAARYSGRRAQRRVRKHQLPGPRRRSTRG